MPQICRLRSNQDLFQDILSKLKALVSLNSSGKRPRSTLSCRYTKPSTIWQDSTSPGTRIFFKPEWPVLRYTALLSLQEADWKSAHCVNFVCNTKQISIGSERGIDCSSILCGENAKCSATQPGDRILTLLVAALFPNCLVYQLPSGGCLSSWPWCASIFFF